MDLRRGTLRAHVSQGLLVVALCVAATSIVLAMLRAASDALGNF